MPIDFFEIPCENAFGDCQTQEIKCLQAITQKEFGISDSNSASRTPAIVMLSDKTKWDVIVQNPQERQVQYKAIDYCVEIYRTGTYNVNDDASDIQDFSSDKISLSDSPELIKRCEGMLIEQNMGILFFELKVCSRSKWLADARKKFEETILSFKEHHPDKVNQIVEPVVSNKAFAKFRVHQNLAYQNRILKDKIGKELKVTTEILIP